MGDVRIPAVATLAAAIIAVVGSMFVVWRSGQQQRRLQQREFADRASAREAQWAEERARGARAAEVDACVQFDAAVVIAVAHLRRMVDLVGRPGVRRGLFGRKWAEHWNRQLTEASIELALPLSTVRLTAGPQVRQAVSDVARCFEGAANAVSSLPQRIPESLLVGLVIQGWRERVEASIEGLHAARGVMAAVLESSVDGVGGQPSGDKGAARS
ncbi:hypothetical protein [Modestobacter sp. VKM Ac-2985]|uniref:hypothetical protein n=1 Tax=Modestobacter sp. VKM Ac-2985 TaxID=3004139 RepID=UPI0022AB6F24|nr:hypothetical protein [Modestobacter sp. VKM Ac-2985]MCZ2835952.1 hypothetical protein [Modestobacter sp. VKM Ac-2985]